MHPISDDLRQALNRNATLMPKATLKLASGTTRELAGDDIVDLEAESSTSSESSFDIGACVVGKCSITLNNHDGRFDSYDFTGATVTTYVGKTFDAIRDETFTELAPSTNWELEAASDEMIKGSSSLSYSGSYNQYRYDFGGNYTPDDGRSLLVRVRYYFTSDIADDQLLAACGNPTLLTSGGSEVRPSEVIRSSAETYAIPMTSTSITKPRVALVCYEMTPQAGRAVRYLRIPIRTGYGSIYVDVSCVPMNRTEWVRLGVYNVDQPDSYSGTISLDCLDNMSKLSRPYSDVTSTFPDKPAGLIEDIFRKCNMTVTWNSQPAYTQQVTRRPDSSSLTCLQAVADLCQMMGLWCRADEWGNAYLSWYDSAAFEQEGWLDGGSYETSSRPYSDGSRADGGNFTSYSSGSSYNGGTFDTNRQVGHVLAPFSSTVMTDDVVVTGISVTASNEIKIGDDGKETNGADGETALSGRSGYVLEVKSNPFIEYGKASAVANALNSRIGGMRFRPLSATAPSDPSIEAGDSLVVGDRKGNYYRAYATTVSLKVCDSMTVKCSAKSAARNSATTASAATQAIVQARNELKREQNRAEKDLADKLAEASGLYETNQRQSDGSTIYYLHDKSTLQASKIIWKMTSQAVAVSTDGGKTYATGLTADGTALLNRIYAIGIDADYITSGTYTVVDNNKNVVLKIGKDIDGGIAIANPYNHTLVSARKSMFSQPILLDGGTDLITNYSSNTDSHTGWEIDGSVGDYRTFSGTLLSKTVNTGSADRLLVLFNTYEDVVPINWIVFSDILAKGDKANQAVNNSQDNIPYCRATSKVSYDVRITGNGISKGVSITGVNVQSCAGSPYIVRKYVDTNVRYLSQVMDSHVHVPVSGSTQGTSDSPTRSHFNGSQTHMCLFTGLRNYTSYTLTIIVYHKVGIDIHNYSYNSNDVSNTPITSISTSYSYGIAIPI